MLHYNGDSPLPTGKESINISYQLQKAIAKARTSLDKSKRCNKSYFNKRLRKVQDRPTVVCWFFLDSSDSLFKPSGDEKPKLTQCGALVERFTVDRITPAPLTFDEPESLFTNY